MILYIYFHLNALIVSLRLTRVLTMYGKRVQGRDRKRDKSRLAKKCGDKTEAVIIFVCALSFAFVKSVLNVSQP